MPKFTCKNPECGRPFIRVSHHVNRGTQPMYCSDKCNKDHARQKRSGKLASIRKRRRWRQMKLPVMTREEIEAAIKAANVKITKLPLGSHLGWVPEWMR